MLFAQLAALALAVISLVASGCGGSSKTGSTATAAALPPIPAAATTGKPLTKTELIATADAICAHTNHKLSGLTIVDKNEFARLIPEVAVYFASEAEELNKLVATGAIKPSWATMLKDFYRYGEDVGQVARYDQAKNFKASVPILQTAEALHQELEVLAKHEGFTNCARLS
jgi:hypothetical protein